MKIDDKYEISFDPYGNLYCCYDNICYQLNVDKDNRPVLIDGSYEIIKLYDQDLDQFMLLDRNNSLRAKIKKEIEKLERIDEDDEVNSDEEYFNNIKEDYYPENNDHIIDDGEDKDDSLDDDDDLLDDDVLKKYGKDNYQFNFYKNGASCECKIFHRENGDITSLYDVYVYDNLNNLAFKSVSSDNSAIFRIRIYQTGDLFIRTIGSSDKKYKFNLENKNLSLFVC